MFGDPTGSTLGVNLNNNNEDQGQSNRVNGGDSTQSIQDHVKRVYDRSNPQSQTTNYTEGRLCTHEGQMEEVPAGYDDSHTCNRASDGIGETLAANNPVENTPERQASIEADEAFRRYSMQMHAEDTGVPAEALEAHN